MLQAYGLMGWRCGYIAVRLSLDTCSAFCCVHKFFMLICICCCCESVICTQHCRHSLFCMVRRVSSRIRMLQTDVHMLSCSTPTTTSQTTWACSC